MPEIILHIGRHKTGSTSLQSFLALNEELLLASSGILYPRAGRDAEMHYHHPIFQDVIEDGRPMNTCLVEEIIDESNRKDASRVLLSSEMISRSSVTEEQLQEIRNSFGKNRVSIIVYLRKQDTMLQSMYAERVKRGLLVAPDTIFDIEGSLDYHAFIVKFANVFGKQAITIRIFEHAVQNIYMDLIGALGASTEAEYAIPDRRRNERLPWSYIELLRHANATTLGRKIVLHSLMRRLALSMRRLLPNLMDRPGPLKNSERASLIQAYTESNRRLAQEYLDRRDLFQGDEAGS
jgi:hypothetical protein